MFRRRRMPPIPQPPGEVSYRRCEIDYDSLIRNGWPADLQRVRMALPAHLHGAPPQPWARPAFRSVQANVGSCAVGLTWSLPWVGPESWGVIEEVSVVAPWQRRGIGTELVRESIMWMAESGGTSVVICPTTGTQWVEALGFRPMEGGCFIKPMRAEFPDCGLDLPIQLPNYSSIIGPTGQIDWTKPKS
jgi:GNAT superfamily N-acetyltransferase